MYRKKLRAFGVDVHVHILKEHRKKLDSKSWQGVFTGYSHNGYRIWDPRRKKIAVMRDGENKVSVVQEVQPSRNYVRVSEIQKEPGTETVV